MKEPSVDDLIIGGHVSLLAEKLAKLNWTNEQKAEALRRATESQEVWRQKFFTTQNKTVPPSKDAPSDQTLGEFVNELKKSST